ncbi:hypothetical protein L208DRAFT_575967 [Tricholoma matsutake]|nr:hypothetical protein L208DRAFT_575967 [Tricholoma matsutake 945]
MKLHLFWHSAHRYRTMVSAHLSLALQWIGLLNTLNYTGMASVMSPNFAYLDRLANAPIGYFNISLPTAPDTVENNDTVIFYTRANGKSKHGFPFLNEYMFTFTFENSTILSVIEFVDPTIISAWLTNETIVAQASGSCPE